MALLKTKLAWIHCRIAKWGALDVFIDLLKEKSDSWKFSKIKIFTIYSELKNINIDNHKIEITTALPKRLNKFFQRNSKAKLPILKQIFDYRNLIFFYPILMKIISWKIKRYNPDHILISSFAVAKNIDQAKYWICTDAINRVSPKITLYLHSPMQYIRSHNEEYKQKLKWWKWRLFRRIISRLKKRDLQYREYNEIYTNSNFTNNLAKKIYNIDGKVKYPKVNQIYFDEKIITKPKEYFVCTWRVVKFVREIDLIIKAFNKINYPLIIIWSWPDEQELKKIANDNITFTWRKTPKESIEIIKNAKWTINLTKESFGLSTAESLCLWVPVLWYNQWATPELVNKKSGILIENKTEKTIIDNFSIFIKTNRNREEIAENARKTFNNKYI